MGLFSSRSSSKNTTNNYDQRVINDYQGSDFDYGVDGTLNNNTGTINMVDAGSLEAMQSALNTTETLTSQALTSNTDIAGYAIGAANSSAGNALEFGQGVFSDALSVVDGVASDGLTLADSVNARTLDAAISFNDNAVEVVGMGNDLAYALADNAASQNMAALSSTVNAAGFAVDAVRGISTDALEYTGSLFDTGTDAILSSARDAMTLADGTNQRTLNAAMNIADASLESQSMGNELAFALANNAQGQSESTLNALGDGFAQMMQFTETFSRSDGASLAKTNLYTVGVIAVAGVAAVFFLRGK